MRLRVMTGVLALGVSGIALGADCPQVDVRDTGRVESNGWGAARQFEVKNLGADREYIRPHYTLWVKPGQSRRVAVGEPQWGSGFTGSRADIDKGPFTLRLSDHRFKCTYRSEPFVPAEMDVRK